MVNKRRRLFLASAALLLLLILVGYWFYFAPPGGFPGKQQAIKEMMKEYPEADIELIQDIIFIDSEHVLAPFITKDDGYGLSYWEWRKHRWEFARIDSGATPQLWKTNPKDPGSYYITWNFHPDNQLANLNFYLKKDGNFSISDGKHHYFPKVQMELKIDVGEKSSYGFTKIPDEWNEFITGENQLTASSMPNTIFSDFFPPAQFYIGWSFMNKDGSGEYPPFPGNSHGFESGDNHIEHIRYLNKEEIYQ
ncbi:hypothetical protein J7E38_18545 [Bacillus sp. ISL-35]|uniref:hypothetical protein n=1 Tax=Bacillus sp. ISL-35 TaxID=2819122 RepID=UPI001BE6C8FD|nr:hypothetical protein [Bacillus sp. ISL-35]MBT2680993.1 hypothetical protein [Bacillus sp. ISL-35]MBT2705312.1 hypothetical protein [Chryseobacterium sp. ISL-80]